MTTMTETKTPNAKADCPNCNGTGTEIVFGEPCTCLTPKARKIVPATPGQVGFMLKLLTERPSFDTDGSLAAKITAGDISKNGAKAVIDALLAAPVEVHEFKKNFYPKPCATCGVVVLAEAGRVEKAASGKWITFHLDGECPTSEEIAEIEADKVTEPGMYKVGDDILKVRWNQGKSRLYALRLVHIADRIDWEYSKSAMDFIRAEHALTAAEAHEFGASFNTCVNCLKDLTDDKSVVAKYGHTCAKNLGWRYPTKKEADAVLAGDITWAEILAEPVREVIY